MGHPVALKAMIEYLPYISPALQDCNHLQRFGIRSIDDQIRINRKELNGFARQIFAPMASTGIFAQKYNPLAHHGFNTVAVSSLFCSLM
jgi:hypothetical protein